jgi:phosphoketolase
MLNQHAKWLKFHARSRGGATGATASSWWSGGRAVYAKRAMRDKLIEHEQYIDRHGKDMPVAAEWALQSSVPSRDMGGVV